MISAEFSNSDTAHRDRSVLFHDFCQASLQGAAIAALGLLLLLLLIPVSTAAIPDTSIFNLEYTHAQMKYRFYYEGLAATVQGAVAVTGMLLALFLFRFMLVRKSSDAYFAMGISRLKLLLARYMAGTLYLAAVVVIPLLISLMLNLAALGEFGFVNEMLSGFAYVTMGCIMLGLVSFTVTALSCCLAGTIWEAAGWAATLLAAPSMLLYGFNALARKLLFGLAWGQLTSSGTVSVNDSLISRLESFNPVLFFYKPAQSYSAQYVATNGSKPEAISWWLLGGWAAAAVAIAGLAYLALVRRRAEIAGVSGQNHAMALLTSFCFSFLSFSVVLEYAAGLGVIPAMAIAAVVFAVMHGIALAIQRREVLNRLSSKAVRELALQLGLALATAVVLAAGGLGYSARIPSIDDVASADMTYAGSPNYLGAPVVGTSSGSNSYYIMSSYNYSEEADIRRVQALHRMVIEAGKQPLKPDSADFTQTAVPYDIIIRYNLWNGGTITRYYDRATMETLSRLLALDETNKVKQAVSDTLSGSGNGHVWATGAYRQGKVYINNHWYSQPFQLNLNDAQRLELLGNISKDVAEQSVEERYYPKTPPIGVIMFTQQGGTESLRFGYRIENALVYVTPDFSHTIEYLTGTGLLPYFNIQPEIEQMALRVYNPYGELQRKIRPRSPYFMSYSSDYGEDFIQIKDFGADLVIREPDQLARLAPLLRNDYFMSGGGYLVSVKLKNSKQYVYKFLPAADAPAFVADAAGLSQPAKGADTP
ncbi:MAG: hypothetical protein K0R57_1741 [Paenibacillaceae bacterium]|jgi:ABC-2 type transport system permease protein|nr:hypothetical protein [Paenibacillaceae bacterium]